LIIPSNFEMMLNGWTTASIESHRQSPTTTRNLAHLVEMKYGKITDLKNTNNVIMAVLMSPYWISFIVLSLIKNLYDKDKLVVINHKSRL